MNDMAGAGTHSRRLNLELVSALSVCLELDARPTVRVRMPTRIVSMGDRVGRLPLIRCGTIDAVLHQFGADANPVLPVSWGAGELALVSQIFSDQPSGADLVALAGCEFRWIPVPRIEQALIAHPHLLVLLVRFLVARLREGQQRERVWLERGVRERVIATLARLGGRSEKEGGPGASYQATHEQLALRCGVSRSRLSRELKQLEAEGLLRLGRGRLELLDPEGLAALLDGQRP